MNLNIKHRQLFIVIALGVIIASFFYPIVTIVLAQQVEGYSHMRDLISELGVSTLPFAWILSAVLLIDALLIFGLAFAVHGSIGIGQRDQKKLASALIGLFGLSLFIGGLFPCDVNCDPESINGWIHTLNIVPSIIAIWGAPFLLRKKFASEERLPAFFATSSYIVGVLLVVFVLASMFLFPMLELTGFGQRLVLVLQLVFFSLVAAAVIHVNLLPTNRSTHPDITWTRQIGD
ncbi:MAG TPA: DUF998 domain-containing protein [Gemmatimonadales bacterium]|nr:DUF998 domain-containing protein [Gemmatimonadales bacterium]